MTRTTQHTPGPWRVEGSAIVGPQHGEGGPWYVAHHPTSPANARLIAAAPDLLAAAKVGLRYIESDYETSRGDYGGVSADVALIRAAIARAEGDAP